MSKDRFRYPTSFPEKTFHMNAIKNTVANLQNSSTLNEINKPKTNTAKANQQIKEKTVQKTKDNSHNYISPISVQNIAERNHPRDMLNSYRQCKVANSHANDNRVEIDDYFVEDFVNATPSCSQTRSSQSSSGDMDVEEISDVETENIESRYDFCNRFSRDGSELSLLSRRSSSTEDVYDTDADYDDHPCTANESSSLTVLDLEMDLIQVIFEQLIMFYATDSKLRDKTSVFFHSFKAIMTLAKMTSVQLRKRTNNKNFWMSLHMACYNQRHHLGSHFKEVSFKTTYVEHISELTQERLRTNLLDMVLGNTDELKLKRSLAMELSVSNAVILPRRYVDVVFYTVHRSLSNTLYARRATPFDPPSSVQYLVQEDYDALMMAIREVEMKARLEHCYVQNSAESDQNNDTPKTVEIATT